MRGEIRWSVRIGAALTGGRPEHRFFKTRKEADAFVRDLRSKQTKFGDAAAGVSLELIAEAAACQERLAGTNASLTSAVEFYLRNRAEHRGFIFADLANEFLDNCRRRQCREKTLSEYRSKLRRITVHFGHRRIAELECREIDNWINRQEIAPRTKRGYLRVFSTLFNFARKRGYCQANPADQIDPPIDDDKPPGILTPEQCLDLLACCDRLYPELLAAVCVGLFGGLRRSELFALDWCNVDGSQQLIRVTAASSKTRTNRWVTINDTLQAWLNSRSQPNGRFVPYAHIDSFGIRLKRMAGQAGIRPWPHNALRHSFGSYFLALSGNENLTAQQMGNTPDVVIRHYRALVRPSEVEKFWDLRPGLSCT